MAGPCKSEHSSTLQQLWIDLDEGPHTEDGCELVAGETSILEDFTPFILGPLLSIGVHHHHHVKEELSLYRLMIAVLHVNYHLQYDHLPTLFFAGNGFLA